MKVNGTPRKSSYNATLEAIGKKLTELRLKKGYHSRIEFALSHDLSHIQYWRMEKGAANLTFKSLDKVLAIHGLTIEKLFEDLARGNSVKGRSRATTSR